MTEAEKAALWRPKDMFDDWRDLVPDQVRLGPVRDIKRLYFAWS